MCLRTSALDAEAAAVQAVSCSQEHDGLSQDEEPPLTQEADVDDAVDGDIEDVTILLNGGGTNLDLDDMVLMILVWYWWEIWYRR